MADAENPKTPSPSKKNSKASRNGGEELSPALTTTSSTLSSPQTITIDHTVRTSHNNTRSRSAMLLGMSKPALALVAALLLATTGSAAWFFSEWLTIPGLNAQIESLEQQVNRLEHQVDRLNNENDRYTTLNNQLNETAQEYQELNQELRASTIRLEEVNVQLNHSNYFFQQLNLQLESQNELYANMNDQLNATTLELKELNSDLFSIVSFLNSTASDLQQSFANIASYLADQIDVSRMLVVETLQNTYQQRSQSWDCDFQRYFLTEPTNVDGTIPLKDETIDNADKSQLAQVMDYVESRLLSDLCLDRDNVLAYLSNAYGEDANIIPTGPITSNQLLQGLNRYVRLAMDYYFSDPGADAGVTPNDWALAGYSCANLERPFLWSP